jgi:F-type H+-transporting ATPase subunit gamma
MKLVSASKLRRAQDSILRFRPYASKLREIMQRVAAGVDDLPNEGVFAHRPVKNVLLVVFSANRGLCGVFNANIGKQVMLLLENEYAEAFAAGKVDFISFGKKAPDTLKKRGVVFSHEYNHLIEKPNFDEVSEIGNILIKEFAHGKYDEIVLVYNQFKNAASQATVSETFLPFHFSSDAKDTGDYILEPEREKMFEMLVPKTLRIQLYKALLDSIASEHGARMTSMHKATDNAAEILKDLRLSYNKARQTAITNEIIEIVSGAEALKG